MGTLSPLSSEEKTRAVILSGIAMIGLLVPKTFTSLLGVKLFEET
jgi:hypothetical protein